MHRYIATRISALVLNLFLVSLLTFLTLRILPGDISNQFLGDYATPQQVANFRAAHGLERPARIEGAVRGRGAGELYGIRGPVPVTSLPFFSMALLCFQWFPTGER